MLRVERISDYKIFREHKDIWNTLLAKTTVDSIFLTYEWIDAYINCLLKDDRLLVLLVIDKEIVVGIAPLVIRRFRYFGFPVRVVSFIGTDVSDRMDFILGHHHHMNRQRCIYLIMDYLINIKSEWDFIDLDEIAEDTGTLDIIISWLRSYSSLKDIVGPVKKSFYIQFNGNKDEFLREFSKKFNRRLKKSQNRQIEMDFEFNRCIGKEFNTDEVFFAMEMIEKDSWKGRKKTGIFSKRDIRDFHKNIFKTFYKNKWLDLSFLNINNKPVAFIYNFLYGNKIYNYSIAFNRHYSIFSPGTTLMLWTVNDTASRDIREFDFIRGDETWKSRFTRRFRIHGRVRIFKDSLYSIYLFYLQSKLAPYIRRKKSLHRMWMKLKERQGWI